MRATGLLRRSKLQTCIQTLVRNESANLSYQRFVARLTSVNPNQAPTSKTTERSRGPSCSSRRREIRPRGVLIPSTHVVHCVLFKRLRPSITAFGMFRTSSWRIVVAARQRRDLSAHVRGAGRYLAEGQPLRDPPLGRGRSYTRASPRPLRPRVPWAGCP